MTLHLPAGKKVAVAIGADFDAHAAWKGAFDRTSPSYLSRGEFGAEVGVPRLLDLFARYDIKATFCTPSHTMKTFPERIRDILEGGHEIAAHGCYHESIPAITAEHERELMIKQLQHYDQIIGGRPRGYRSPAWDFSDTTLSLLEEFGFEWDSSLMGREFDPYHPRPVITDWMEGNTFAAPSPILEIPVSWYLDDWPAMEYVAGISQGLGDHDVLYRRWRDIFDYARTRTTTPAVYALTLHPQCSGRSFLITMLEQLIQHMHIHNDTWFCTLSDIYDAWTDD
jgi:peptidoglycan/xylan/chitin deacetylase (PgdA/CDA1 family)